MDNCFGSKTPIPFWYPSLDQKPGRVVSLFWVYNPFFLKLCYPFNVLNFMFPSLYWYSLVTVWLWLVFILCISRVIQTTLDILAFFNTLLLSFSFLFVLVFFLLSLVVMSSLSEFCLYVLCTASPCLVPFALCVSHAVCLWVVVFASSVSFVFWVWVSFCVYCVSCLILIVFVSCALCLVLLLLSRCI